ncbi:MAG: class I SAM-dependent methyltransferase [Paracoccus sp. (in: a-proteobacteria)]|nr:class I SAM-dependent methyltransferase [Paracoccus sp. (in: a-proteobacteria)]
MAGSAVFATSIDEMRAPPRDLPAGHLGPDDPELVWGEDIAPTANHLPYRLRPCFDAGQIAAQLCPSTDNGSRGIRYLEELCRPVAPILKRRSLRVLQAGCGVGNWIGFLASHVSNLRFTGIDRSKACLEVARSRFGGMPGIRLVQSELLARPELGEFDLVLLDYEILNHFSLDDAQRILEWAHHSLAAGGVVFGDIRLSGDGKERQRELLCNRSGRGFLYRTGVLREGVEGRATVTWDLRTGIVKSLLQDVIRCWTQQDCRTVFRGFDTRFDALDRIETDKAECRSNQSFLIRRP